MRYAGIIKNDFAAAPGTCVTFFTQGCPHKCQGCHNPETWNFDGGKEFTSEVLDEIYKALKANNIDRKFCIMGGEPLAPSNQFLTYMVIKEVKRKFPDIKIYLWTGYILEEIYAMGSYTKDILHELYAIIDGPYVEEERDITLPMRGSRNQRILYKGIDF